MVNSEIQCNFAVQKTKSITFNALTIMGLFGLGKGIAKVVGGIVTGEGEMIVSGLKRTAINDDIWLADLCGLSTDKICRANKCGNNNCTNCSKRVLGKSTHR